MAFSTKQIFSGDKNNSFDIFKMLQAGKHACVFAVLLSSKGLFFPIYNIHFHYTVHYFCKQTIFWTSELLPISFGINFCQMDFYS